MAYKIAEKGKKKQKYHQRLVYVKKKQYFCMLFCASARVNTYQVEKTIAHIAMFVPLYGSTRAGGCR